MASKPPERDTVSLDGAHHTRTFSLDVDNEWPALLFAALRLLFGGRHNEVLRIETYWGRRDPLGWPPKVGRPTERSVGRREEPDVEAWMDVMASGIMGWRQVRIIFLSCPCRL